MVFLEFNLVFFKMIIFCFLIFMILGVLLNGVLKVSVVCMVFMGGVVEVFELGWIFFNVFC